MISQHSLQHAANILSGDKVSIVAKASETRPVAVDLAPSDGAASQQHAAGGAVVGATAAVDANGATELGHYHHGRMPPASAELPMQR